jgi:predicted acylesterase/phospholipase RssA
VVLSGGGIAGAYGVGVLKALLTNRERPFHPEVFAGTSIGSLNASFLVSQWGTDGLSAIANLETLWLDQISNQRGGLGRNGIYRLRGSLFDLLNPEELLANPFRVLARLADDGVFFLVEGLRMASHFAHSQEDLWQRCANLFHLSLLFSSEPLDAIIKNLDFARIRSSRHGLRIISTNWQSGELRTFDNKDMTDEMGPLIIAASSAIPGFLRPVLIGAEPHVDGGVLMNTPLTPAIQAGASELHVIYIDPRVYTVPLPPLESTLDSAYRQQLISWANAVNENIETVRRVRTRLAAQERQYEHSEAGRRDFLRLARLMDVRGLMGLTIHRYHFHDDLAGSAVGLFNFDRRHVERMIKQGFHDASQHDCNRSRCVRSETSGSEAASSAGRPRAAPLRP